jgi:hypothetical protein
MGFKKLPDNLGMVYVPECDGGKKKHPCPDCFSCQWCSNDRCRACKEKQTAGKKKSKTEPGNL